MRILGIDPGTKIAGYGIIDMNIKTKEVTYITHGLVYQKGISYPISLPYIPKEIKKLIREYLPQVAIIEGIHATKGYKSHQKQTEVSGCIKQVFVSTNTPFIDIPSTTLKRIITGNGYASKEEVARSISTQMNIPFIELVEIENYKTGPKKGQLKNYILDGSDALGIALSFPVYFMEQKGRLEFKGV